ncbi:hypothetical protein [Rossellomorea sp. YZS02]|uniref:hypothetical protein n=1 Tax=Rossellomorea sp. YZS02 TaxID=3097358 RepID=UPI002A0FB0A8|nr:hypothetical protein [Rossellomorea sp. YZS02]MDX8345775.1 hypothetical protein [Rossellomorea sp. YZS02]
MSTTSGVYSRSTVVVPQNATITGIALHTRDNIIGTVTATVVRSTTCDLTPVDTAATVTVNDPDCCDFAPASVAVNECDLLSVRIDYTASNLTTGVAVTILLS